MPTIRPTTIRTVARNLPKARQLLKNMGRITSDYFYGTVHDMKGLKDNALLVSSLVITLSRIAVANKSAREARGQEDELLRYKEAVRTTVRELLGFFLSYVILRAIQRNMADFFKNLLLIQKGMPGQSTILGKMGVWRSLCKVPAGMELNATTAEYAFPTLKQTLGKLGKQLKAFIRGQKLPKAKLTSIDHLYPDEIISTGMHYHPDRQVIYEKWIKPWAERFHRWAGKDPNATDYQKLASFMDWAPAIIGSIPALFLSGFALERFSQNHAEGVAQNMAKFMRGHQDSDTPVEEDEPDLPVDPPQSLAYADPNMTAVPNRGYFNGYPYAIPNFAPVAADADGFGNRYRPFTPY